MSTEQDQINELMDYTTNLVLILGAANFLITTLKCKTEKEERLRDWIIDSSESVIYKIGPSIPLSI